MGDGQPSDAEVIRRCRRGETEIFRILVERYQDRIYGLSYRLLGHAEDALDAAQETFLRTFTALPEFDLSRPFAPWLTRIATNTCYGVLRKRRPIDFSLDSMDDAEADAILVDERVSSDPFHAIERALRDEAIQQAVLALSEPYRSVILLRYGEELSYEAIAEALEVPLGTIKTWLHRAHHRLRQSLAGQEVRS